jgi:hypothetical protein
VEILPRLAGSNKYLAAVDSVTGTATGWNPNLNASISALALNTTGAQIFIGGGFTSVGSEWVYRNNIAALDANGVVTNWNPNANNTVSSLAVSPDGTKIYAIGSFTTIGSASRNLLAALDSSTGSSTAWNPNPNTSPLLNSA